MDNKENLLNENFSEQQTENISSEEKSLDEKYYDENIEKLESVYQVKKKKENTSKITSNIDIEKFKEDEFPPVREEDQQDESLEHIHVEYNLTEEEIESGMKTFQRKTLFRRNMIYTGAFLVVMIIYFIQIFGNGTRSSLTYIGMAICVGAMFVIWYNPWNYRKKIAKAMSTVEDNFTMNIYEEYIYIIEESGGFIINYKDEKVFIIEQDNKYIICVGKERIYIVPKRCLKEGNEAVISKYFEKLNDRFYSEINL